MTPLKPPQNRRAYRRHCLYTLENALKAVGEHEGWLESLGEVGDALRAWRADLVADLGGEEAVSAQERAVVELATRTHLLLESVDRWLRSMPSLVKTRAGASSPPSSFSASSLPTPWPGT